MSLPPSMPAGGPPFTSGQYGYMPQERSTGLAIAALILGIISIPTAFICVGGILGAVAVILGIVAAVRASGQPERFGGKGMAITGVVTGALGVIMIFILIPAGLMLFKTFGGAVQADMRLEALGQGLRAYHATHGEYPPDLDTLFSSGQLQGPLFAELTDAGASAVVGYSVGLDPSVPPHWILAYQRVVIASYPMCVVLLADGSTDALDEQEFQRAMQTFENEYKARHGRPPVILKSAAPAADHP